jgi:hypothetical protein
MTFVELSRRAAKVMQSKTMLDKPFERRIEFVAELTKATNFSDLPSWCQEAIRNSEAEIN